MIIVKKMKVQNPSEKHVTIVDFATLPFMESRNIPFNEARVHVSISGHSGERPLVFLHGNSLSSETFKKQFEKLAMPLIAIDLPGHGRSEPAKDPEATYSIPGYTKMVEQVIAELNLPELVLVGHSLGGHIAIQVARKMKQVKGLLVFGTPPLGSITDLGQAFLPNPLFPLLLQGPVSDTDAQKLADDMLNQKDEALLLKRNILSTDPFARSFFAGYIGKGVIENEVEILRTRVYPVAVFHGIHDSLANKAYIDGLGLANLWNGNVQVIENSGHCPQLEQAEAFNELLSAYYSSLQRTLHG